MLPFFLPVICSIHFLWRFFLRFWNFFLKQTIGGYWLITVSKNNNVHLLNYSILQEITQDLSVFVRSPSVAAENTNFVTPYVRIEFVRNQFRLRHKRLFLSRSSHWQNYRKKTNSVGFSSRRKRFKNNNSLVLKTISFSFNSNSSFKFLKNML